MALVGMARRPDATADLKAVRTSIGAALRTLLSDVLREPIPDRMIDLLKQLDQPSPKRPEC
jgi:Anti-sigma factor NepR